VQSAKDSTPAATQPNQTKRRRPVPQANRIGEQLRMLYAEVFAEPIPPQWTELVKRLGAQRNDSDEDR